MATAVPLLGWNNARLSTALVDVVGAVYPTLNVDQRVLIAVACHEVPLVHQHLPMFTPLISDAVPAVSHAENV